MASSAQLEIGSALGRAAFPWGALGIIHEDLLLPLIGGSGLILKRGSNRTQHSPVHSWLSGSRRLAQLLTASVFTAGESQLRIISPGHPPARAATAGQEPHLTSRW